MVRDLDRQMDAEAEHQAEHQMTVIESYRQSYLGVLARKMDAIEACLDVGSFYDVYNLSETDEIARSHFLYYVDQIFTAPPTINRPVRLAEALSMADGTQTKLNYRQTGRQYIYDMSELRTRIAEIMLEDDTEKAKQDVIDMYDRNIRDIVLRFVNDS